MPVSSPSHAPLLTHAHTHTHTRVEGEAGRTRTRHYGFRKRITLIGFTEAPGPPQSFTRGARREGEWGAMGGGRGGGKKDRENPHTSTVALSSLPTSLPSPRGNLSVDYSCSDKSLSGFSIKALQINLSPMSFSLGEGTWQAPFVPPSDTGEYTHFRFSNCTFLPFSSWNIWSRSADSFHPRFDKCCDGSTFDMDFW